MIDISAEQLISLPQAAALLPGRPSLCAIWRWRTRGVRGRKLESVVVGGTPYTSLEAIQRFAEQQGGTDAPAMTIRTPRQRERAIARAERELREMGI